MSPWIPSSGVGTSDPGVHTGQSLQPRPDPVSRTVPPVAMMSTFSTNEIQAQIRSAREVPEGLRSRAWGDRVLVTSFLSLAANRGSVRLAFPDISAASL